MMANRLPPIPVSHPLSFPRVAGVTAMLLSAWLISGCNRNPPPPAAGAVATPAGTAAAPATPVPGAAGTVASGAKSAPGSPPAVPGRRAGEAEKDRARASAVEKVPVETAPVTRGPISSFLSFNTTLETEAMVDIYPQTTGQVERLFVEEGVVVKAGTPLLKIEDSELRLDAAEASANYEQLKRNFARTEDLFERKLINKQDYENQSYQLEQARIRHERSATRLAYATVRAPFDGVISSREVQVGARVGTGTKAFSMVKFDEIVARVFVPGRYLPIVAKDQPAVVTSEFLPDRSFKGWVKRISPVIDPKSGTFKVTVGVRSDKPTDLPPGLFVGVRVITDTRENAVLIPKRAVVYEGGERFYFVVANDIASKRKLVAGYEDPQSIEATSGLEPGAEVLVVGHSGLKDGAAVRSVNALAPIPQAAEDAGTPAAVVPAKPAPSGKS